VVLIWSILLTCGGIVTSFEQEHLKSLYTQQQDDIIEKLNPSNNNGTNIVPSFQSDKISLKHRTRSNGGLEYIFEDFDDKSLGFNDFSGNFGQLTGTAISINETHYFGNEGASLKVDFSSFPSGYTGIWSSLFGHIDYSNYVLNLTKFEEIHFYVKGSGLTSNTYKIRVELKDYHNDWGHTAYYDFTFNDNNINWQKIILDADVTNNTFWTYNSQIPDMERMKTFNFILLEGVNPSSGVFYIDHVHFVDMDDSPFNISTHTENEFLDLVEKGYCNFFDIFSTNPLNFTLERSVYPDVYSVAGLGFQLSTICIEESRGWVNSNDAINKTISILGNLYNLPQGNGPAGFSGYQGFFYHFLGENGYRKNTSTELSSIDTAILMAGIITVREYFYYNSTVVNLTTQLYGRVNWSWMLNSTNNLFYHGWTPEAGFSQYHWDKYTDETILITLLGISSKTYPVSVDTFYAWDRDFGTYDGHSFVISWDGSLFTYFFAHCWLDFQKLGKDNHPNSSLKVDWWDNSVEAVLANRQFCIDHSDDIILDGDDNYTTYNENSWGLTACDEPYHNGYTAYGSLPSYIQPEHDGTVASYGVASSITFLPNESFSALKHYFNNTNLWRYLFGFGDYNLDLKIPWYNHQYLAINNGPAAIMIENYRTGLIWDTFMNNLSIINGLKLIYNITNL
jgi:hypothetical protein